MIQTTWQQVSVDEDVLPLAEQDQLPQYRIISPKELTPPEYDSIVVVLLDESNAVQTPHTEATLN